MIFFFIAIEVRSSSIPLTNLNGFWMHENSINEIDLDLKKKKNSSRGSYSHPKVIPTLILIEPTSTDERRSDLMWQSCCKNETCWSGLEFHYRGRRKKRVPIAFIIIVVEPISNGSIKFPFDAINAYAEKCPASMDDMWATFGSDAAAPDCPPAWVFFKRVAFPNQENPLYLNLPIGKMYIRSSMLH